jgi:hypothetical protein
MMTEQSKVRIVAGYGRSGTTWVQDVLATANSLRPVFEPMHPLHVKGADAFAHQYISANRQEPELFQFLSQFFYGEYRSLWADYRVISRRLLPRLDDLRSIQGCRKRLRYYAEFQGNFMRFNKQRKNPQRIIKLIRANMMLAWLRASFSARIVFIIRHPAAVVLSQMKARQSWDPYAYIDRYRADSELLEILGPQMNRLLFQELEDVEAFTLCWCIENAVALEQAQSCGVPVVHYEQLMNRGLPEWERVLSALDLEGMPDRKLILEPSQQAWGKKAKNAALLLDYASWMSEIDDSMSDRIQRILDETDTNIYRVASALPMLGCGLEK